MLSYVLNDYWKAFQLPQVPIPIHVLVSSLRAEIKEYRGRMMDGVWNNVVRPSLTESRRCYTATAFDENSAYRVFPKNILYWNQDAGKDTVWRAVPWREHDTMVCFPSPGGALVAYTGTFTGVGDWRKAKLWTL